MLGMNSLLPEYIDTLKLLLSLKQTLGIIGGKPRMALFIVGFTETQLIVLDPHLVQQAIRSKYEFKQKIATYYCKAPMVVGFDEIESSFNIGLYFKDKTSWLDFEEKIKNDKRVKGIIAINDHESENISDIIEIDFNS